MYARSAWRARRRRSGSGSVRSGSTSSRNRARNRFRAGAVSSRRSYLACRAYAPMRARNARCRALQSRLIAVPPVRRARPDGADPGLQRGSRLLVCPLALRRPAGHDGRGRASRPRHAGAEAFPEGRRLPLGRQPYRQPALPCSVRIAARFRFLHALSHFSSEPPSWPVAAGRPTAARTSARRNRITRGLSRTAGRRPVRAQVRTANGDTRKNRATLLSERAATRGHGPWVAPPTGRWQVSTGGVPDALTGRKRPSWSRVQNCCRARNRGRGGPRRARGGGPHPVASRALPGTGRRGR
jgi:hypothetical protein